MCNVFTLYVFRGRLERKSLKNSVFILQPFALFCTESAGHIFFLDILLRPLLHKTGGNAVALGGRLPHAATEQPLTRTTGAPSAP